MKKIWWIPLMLFGATLLHCGVPSEPEKGKESPTRQVVTDASERQILDARKEGWLTPESFVKPEPKNPGREPSDASEPLISEEKSGPKDSIPRPKEDVIRPKEQAPVREKVPQAEQPVIPEPPPVEKLQNTEAKVLLPQGSIVQPIKGARFMEGAEIQVTLRVTDPQRRMKAAHFYLGTSRVDTKRTPPFQVKLKGLKVGRYLLSVTLEFTGGSRKLGPVAFSIDKPAGQFASPLSLTIPITGRRWYVSAAKKGISGYRGDGSLKKPFATMAEASKVARAGDGVLVFPGVYKETLRPLRDGKAGHYITYMAQDTNKKPVISGIGTGIDIRERAYVHIKGFHVRDTKKWVNGEVRSGGRFAHHIIFQRCWFTHLASNGDYVGHSMRGTRWIRVSHCFFQARCSATKVCTGNSHKRCSNGGPSDLLTIWNSTDVIVDNNRFEGGIHYCLNIMTRGSTERVVVQDNYFHCDLHAGGGFERSPGDVLQQRNIFIETGRRRSQNFCGSEKDRKMDLNKQVSSKGNSLRGIYRQNVYIRPGQGIPFGARLRDGTVVITSEDNRFYHNSIIEAEMGIAFHDNAQGGDPKKTARLTVRNNHFKNNIIYNSTEALNLWLLKEGSLNNVFINNLMTKTLRIAQKAKLSKHVLIKDTFTFDPRFEPSSISLRLKLGDTIDYRRFLVLSSASPAIDKGISLTQTTSGGKGVLVKVEDTRYFTDGWGLIPGDNIQFAGQKQSYQIKKVDHKSKTLTLTQSAIWSKGQGLSMPYKGKAPDLGANER